MSESTTAPVAPNATEPSASAPADPAAATIQPGANNGAEVKLTSGELRKRLDEAAASGQKKFLSQHGIEKPEDLEAKLKRLTELETAQLSEKERTEKQIADLTKLADGAKGLTQVASEAVQELFEALPDQAKAAIEELQPADAKERLKYIRAFRKLTPSSDPATTAPAGATAATTTAPAPPPPPPAPANTAPASNAPKPGTKTKYDEYVEMKARNPVAAGLFYKANQAAIEKARPA